MYQKFQNDCEIIRGRGIEVGIVQTEIPTKPQAWLYWMEGQSITSEHGWSYGTKAIAIWQLNE